MSNWRQFEFDIGSLCEALGYAGEVTPGSGDFGVDILGRRGQRIVAIQCKLYQKSVGCEPIQRLLAAERLHKATDFICITTGYYTKKAKELGSRTGVILIDGDGLEEACRLNRLALPSCTYLVRDDGLALTVENESVIGREQQDCTIVVPSQMVSRRHAIFRFDGPKLQLTDLGSTNGTKLNTRSLASRSITQVTYGDRLEFASESFTLRLRPPN